MKKTVFISAAVFLSFFSAALQQAFSMDSTVPGEVTTPFPTITNLAVEWHIKGDENLNGKVSLEYRMVGEEKWRQGMPLRRIPADKGRTTRRPFYWENRHSGSIFNLRPGTEYEIRLRLSDPDGGKAEKLVRAATRSIPKPAPDAVVKKLNPRSFREAALTAQPGDILLLSPGYYEDFTMMRSGEPGKPIVIRADGTHDVISSMFDSFSFGGRRHVILEGVTVNGSVNLLRAEHVAVRYCTVNAKYGIIAKEPPGCTNCYIADNVVTYVMPWVSLGLGAGMDTGGAACVGEGIQITGPGNVICYNRVKGYRDCISFMEDLGTHVQVCIDVYNNDIYVGADDGIEADFAQGNCRIMRNRLTNCFMGLSSQPGLGGPTYFIRNVMYNIIDCPYKFSRFSKGDVVLNNTCIKVGGGFRIVHNPSLAFFRNNLMIGGVGAGRFGRYGSGEPMAMDFARANETCDMDYDGVGVHGAPFKANVGRRVFDSFESFRENTSEKHAVLVDLNVFNAKVEFPNPAIPEREPADLRLRPGSAAVDAGLFIPNVNDNFTGSAPDLGACELGADPPHYGPRPKGMDEESLWQK